MESVQSLTSKVKDDSTSTSFEKGKRIKDFSENVIRKRVYVLFMKAGKQTLTSDLNTDSYSISIDLESKEKGEFSGEILSLMPVLNENSLLASFHLKTTGDIIYEESTDTSDNNISSFSGNIIDDISMEEEESVRDDLDQFSYRYVTTNAKAFQNFANKILVKHEQGGLGGKQMVIEKVGTMEILPEYANESTSFRLSATTNSTRIFATTDDEIWKGEYSLTAPEDGSRIKANWELDEQLTTELWAYFDNTKIEADPIELLTHILEYRPNYEQEIDQWTITEGVNGYDFSFYVDGTQQFFGVRGHSVYFSGIVDQKGRMDILSYELSKSLKEKFK
ncbi:hypothetical protein [Vagococcus elongatus]